MKFGLFSGEVSKDAVINSMKNFADLKMLKTPGSSIPSVYYIKPKFKEISFTYVATL